MNETELQQSSTTLTYTLRDKPPMNKEILTKEQTELLSPVGDFSSDFKVESGDCAYAR